MSQSILAQVSELNALNTRQLAERWKGLFESAPPLHNRAHLVKRLAYRIQELAYGGLSQESKDRLHEVMEERPAKRIQRNKLTIGTRFVREWQGERHEVTVTYQGFEYRNKPYKSLSAIARTITGTRWSGPVFFGLRNEEAA